MPEHSQILSASSLPEDVTTCQQVKLEVFGRETGQLHSLHVPCCISNNQNIFIKIPYMDWKYKLYHFLKECFDPAELLISLLIRTSARSELTGICSDEDIAYNYYSKKECCSMSCFHNRLHSLLLDNSRRNTRLSLLCTRR